MNKLSKTFLITTALLATAGTAVAVAGPGHGKHDHSGGMSNGMGTGKHMLGHHLQEKGQMGLFNQIPDLTSKHREQLSQLQAEQQEKMLAMHATKLAQREEMKSKIDTILTAEQRQAFAQIQQHKQGHHTMSNESKDK